MAIDKLTLSNFFHLYIFTPKSKKLSEKDQKIAILGNILMGMTLGIGHGICALLYVYDKKMGSHVAQTSDKVNTTATSTLVKGNQPLTCEEERKELIRSEPEKISPSLLKPNDVASPPIERLKNLNEAQKEFYVKIEGNELDLLKQKLFDKGIFLDLDFLDPIVKEIGVQSKGHEKSFTRSQRPFNRNVYDFLIAKKSIFAYSYDNNMNTRIQLTEDTPRAEGENNWVTAASLERAKREVKEFEEKYDSVVDPFRDRENKNFWKPFFLLNVFDIVSGFENSDQFSSSIGGDLNAEIFLDSLVAAHAIKAWSFDTRNGYVRILIGNKGQVTEPLDIRWITVKNVEAVARFKEAFQPLKKEKVESDLELEANIFERSLTDEIRKHPNECFRIKDLEKDMLKACIQKGIIDSYAVMKGEYLIKMKPTDQIPFERSDFIWIKKEDLEKSELNQEAN